MTGGDGILRMDISDDAYPHDKVRGHPSPQSGGQSRTACIISQRREIEKLRAAGVDVDADIKEAALKLFIWRSVADPYYHHHDRAGLTPVHDDLSPAPQLEVETDKQQFKSSPGVGGAQQQFTLTTITQNLKERAQKMNNPTPRGASVRPEDRFLDELYAMVNYAREFDQDGLDIIADIMRDRIRDIVRDSDLSATEQSVVLKGFISVSYKPIEDNAGTVPPIVTVEDAQSLPVMSTKDSATAVAIEQALASEAASCAYTFQGLPVAVRKCGTLKKKKKQKLNSKEALPSAEANSGFINIGQRFAVPRKQTVSSRDMAVGIFLNSAAFMQPLVISIITSQQCIVLAVRLCAVLSVWHTGCDPPLRDLYCKRWTGISLKH
jgi:hypothetical protein